MYNRNLWWSLYRWPTFYLCFLCAMQKCLPMEATKTTSKQWSRLFPHFTWNPALLYLDIFTSCRKHCFSTSKKSLQAITLCYSTSLNVLEWDHFNFPCWHGKHILYSPFGDGWGVSSGDQGSLSPPALWASSPRKSSPSLGMMWAQISPYLKLESQQTRAKKRIQNLLRHAFRLNS